VGLVGANSGKFHKKHNVGRIEVSWRLQLYM
jgi:hypothetical protein